MLRKYAGCLCKVSSRLEAERVYWRYLYSVSIYLWRTYCLGNFDSGEAPPPPPPPLTCSESLCLLTSSPVAGWEINKLGQQRSKQILFSSLAKNSNTVLCTKTSTFQNYQEKDLNFPAAHFTYFRRTRTRLSNPQLQFSVQTKPKEPRMSRMGKMILLKQFCLLQIIR